MGVFVVGLVGWLTRSPLTPDSDGLTVDEIAAPTAKATPTPPGTPRETLVPAMASMMGLDEVLPVIDGVWQEISPPSGNGIAAAPKVMVWDGTEVTVIGTKVVQAYRPATDNWRRLADLPVQEARQRVLSGVAVDNTVIVADTLPNVPLTEEARRSAAWAMVNGSWQDVTTIPDSAQFLGAVDGKVLSARYPGSIRPRAQLWLSDPMGEEPQRLPDPPRPITGGQAIDTPDGFVLLGSEYIGGTGSQQDPFVTHSVALQWSEEAWEVLDFPDVDLSGAAVTWVPVPTGRAQNPDPAGGLAVFASRQGGPGIAGIVYDLASNDWVSVPVPVTETIESRFPNPPLAAAWDGARTVWVYGGGPAPIHLSLDLVTGRLSVAAPTSGFADADLHWDGDSLLLTGGFGPTGPANALRRWTPNRAD